MDKDRLERIEREIRFWAGAVMAVAVVAGAYWIGTLLGGL